jgi:hypothetical protein
MIWALKSCGDVDIVLLRLPDGTGGIHAAAHAALVQQLELGIDAGGSCAPPMYGFAVGIYPTDQPSLPERED